ncbi:MAG: GNAT family N-acetyltransferase [Anaerolineales bacterium]|nr:GNAT family N-acetyltransferase [Anaerolineales bacterium]MCB9126807.1 GNAT family N-acetyltransferase [Ardenticatenales bacterium]
MDLFMLCWRLNANALRPLPDGYTMRAIRPDELTLWKGFPFDEEATAARHLDEMTHYFERVYADRRALFFQRCQFVCDPNGLPVGTGFIWPAYGNVTTLHWIKVKRSYEGRGIGRGMLSSLMRRVAADDYPVYLHTHPQSTRAIKLYRDLGFQLISDPVVGHRTNDLTEGLAYLKAHMPPAVYTSLTLTQAPPAFLDTVARHPFDEF